MKYDYDTLSIEGVSVAEAIEALQEWQASNPEATDTTISLPSYEGATELEVCFYRPFTSAELEAIKVNESIWEARREAQDRETYERLKAKYEG
jgi:hypothetical protein